jgi:hypothetical protein
LKLLNTHFKSVENITDGRFVPYITGCVVNFNLKSTCDVNLLSKLSIIFKKWRVMNNVDRGGARV